MNQPNQPWPADRLAELERPMKPQSKPSRNRDAKQAGMRVKAGKDKGRTVRRGGRASRYLPVGKDDWLDRARGTGKPQFVLVQNGDAPPYLAHVTARSGDTITTSVGTFKHGKHICQPDGSWRIVDGDAPDDKKVYFRWRGKADWSEDIYRTKATDKTPEHQWEVVEPARQVAIIIGSASGKTVRL